MAVSQPDIDRALELFGGLGDLTTRKMFGGMAFYHSGTVFAVLMSDGTLRLKAQGGMIDRMQELGSSQWTFQRPGQKESSMPYWDMPDAALDDPEEATGLAREALSYL